MLLERLATHSHCEHRPARRAHVVRVTCRPVCLSLSGELGHMKRLQLAFVALLALAACEDGPTQTFNPSPEGAGNRWNDGNNAGGADPATQGFNQDTTGTTKQEICNG